MFNEQLKSINFHWMKRTIILGENINRRIVFVKRNDLDNISW